MLRTCFIFIALLSVLVCSQRLFAAPTGEALLHACKAALEDGFTDIEGQMCEWYVTPCDCHAGKDPGIPRVCLPHGIPTEWLAKEVIKGLLEKPALQNVSAEMAANTILSRSYPCTDEDKQNSDKNRSE